MAAMVDRTKTTQPAPTRTRFTALIVSGRNGCLGTMAQRLRQYGARCVLECTSHAEALAKARIDGSHDLCVVDGTTADGPILPLIAELRAMRWRRVVILTERDDAYAVRSALGAGVRGFVVTRAPSTSLFPRATRPVSYRSRSAPNELSTREIEVLQSAAEGHSNKIIGEELGLSALTVKSHLARIARKLGTGDRAEMVAIAIRAGMVS